MASQIYGFHEVQKVDALAECKICFCLDSLMELTDLFCMLIPDYYNFIILNSAFDILGRSGSIISLIDVFKGYACMHAVIFTDCLITKFVLLVHFLSFGAA